MHGVHMGLIVFAMCLKAKIFSLGEWYSCRGTAVAPNTGLRVWGLNPGSHLSWPLDYAVARNYYSADYIDERSM